MHRHIATEVVSLTKELADNFSGLPTFKGDRSRDTAAGRSRIAWLEQLLHDGKFHTPKWATAALDGTIYRVNGGHSSAMLANLNGAFPKNMQCVIDRFACETRDDLADLFSQFDPRQSLRRITDKINAHKGVHDDLDSVSPTDIQRITSGIAYYVAHDGDGPHLDEDAKIRLVHREQPFILWASQFSGKRHFSMTGVAAAMYATWTRHRHEAEVFWEEVRDRSNPSNTNASRMLGEFLIENVSKKKYASGAPLWSTRAYFVKSIHAWNAWNRNETTNLRYMEDCGWPKIW